MNCYIKYIDREEDKIITERIDTNGKIKINSVSVEFETKYAYVVIGTEDILEIYFR